VGSTNQRADPAILQEMQRYRLAASFDDQPIPELNPEAIDFRGPSANRKLSRHCL